MHPLACPFSAAGARRSRPLHVGRRQAPANPLPVEHHHSWIMPIRSCSSLMGGRVCMQRLGGWPATPGLAIVTLATHLKSQVAIPGCKSQVANHGWACCYILIMPADRSGGGTSAASASFSSRDILIWSRKQIILLFRASFAALIPTSRSAPTATSSMETSS